LTEIRKRHESKPAVNCEDAFWLNTFLIKNCNLKAEVPYSLLYKSINELMKNDILPDKLINALRGFSHVMGVYLDRSCYQRERLLYYQADSDFRKIGIDDHACRLLSKIKLIALNNAFDQYAEQELGLIIGLFNREQTKKQYDIISVDEDLYYSMKLKFSSFREKELVHLLAISPVAKKSI